MKPGIAPVELDMKELEALLERARVEPLSEHDYETLKAVVETLAYVTRLAQDRQTTIKELRRLLFGSSTEKTRDVLVLLKQLEGIAAEAAGEGEPDSTPATPERPPEEKAGEKERRRAKGHGRNGADAYVGAERIGVTHGSVKPGERCPECGKGKLYNKAPETLVRIVGQAPIQATLYDLQKLRCNLCGEVFTADPPEGVGPEKYDATAGAMIGLLKYGSGLPFHRQEKLQKSLGIPLPAATQWEIVRDLARVIAPVYEELIRQAAQGEVLYNDDTGMKILALMETGPKQIPKGEDFADRTGIFTSGIVSTREGRKIAVFFTGRKHAGENLSDVLARRAAELGPPIQMCDALDRNLPKQLEVILGNCLVHCRRHFIDVAESFPAECRYVLETLVEVYKNDALARDQGMSPDERLRFHKTRSGLVMQSLQNWLTEQLVDKKVEPNSGLGRAITYMLRHWDALTLFLRQPGAPLDNNLCERALKKAILHRKNSLFYKTQNGANVGDTFMSLVHTCQLCDANPFDYLTELQKHAAELEASPQQWLPWNYRATLEGSIAFDEAPG